MKEYRVNIISSTIYSTVVEANSEEEAYEIGQNMDGADFTPSYDIDWEVHSVVEIKEEERCKYCDGNCPNDEDNACDGYLGDINGLYKENT
jgi:hypothetical protein